MWQVLKSYPAYEAQRAVAQELKRGAMEAVGSALGDQIDLTASREAELGRVRARLHLEFLDRIDIGPEHDRTVEAAVVRRSVHEVAVEVAAPAVYAETVSVGGAGGHTRSERREL